MSVVTALLLIADGAAGTFPAVATPHLDRLPHRATLQTVPAGLPVASEVALPSLMGRWLSEAPARGAVEAAAVRRPLGADEAAWRLDIPNLADADEDDQHRTAARLRTTGTEVRHLRRGRFLLVGPRSWLAEAPRPWLTAVERALGSSARLWGGGPTPVWAPLERPTAVVAAPTGAAAGVARLLGADTVTPVGTTGFADTDLPAKARAARRLLEAREHELVVVHVGAVDEAGHARDAALQRSALTAFDRELVGPMTIAAREVGVPLMVTADHGTDPSTGLHVGGLAPAFVTVAVPDGPAPEAVAALVAAPKQLSAAPSAGRTTGAVGRSADAW